MHWGLRSELRLASVRLRFQSQHVVELEPKHTQHKHAKQRAQSVYCTFYIVQRN